MKHIRNAQSEILQIDSKYFGTGISQITIDLIESTDLLLHQHESRPPEEEKLPTMEDLSSLIYDCDNVLAVLNPVFESDKEALTELVTLLRKVLSENQDYINLTNQLDNLTT